jgi:hypothetical protein
MLKYSRISTNETNEIVLWKQLTYTTAEFVCSKCICHIILSMTRSPFIHDRRLFPFSEVMNLNNFLLSVSFSICGSWSPFHSPLMCSAWQTIYRARLRKAPLSLHYYVPTTIYDRLTNHAFRCIYQSDENTPILKERTNPLSTDQKYFERLLFMKYPW